MPELPLSSFLNTEWLEGKTKMTDAKKMRTGDGGILGELTKTVISFCWVVPLLGIKEAIALIDIDNPANLFWKWVREVTHYGQAGSPLPGETPAPGTHLSDLAAFKNVADIPSGNSALSD